jgi:type III secretion protein V
MPGKQMSIDADLRANILTGDQARMKRATLALESALHGGMDGAMKFVKGDAVAGLIITMINIVAGIAVGIEYHGMTASEAMNRFSILSIGDAMVSQVPSLLLSVAAGVMITRVADEREEKPLSLGAEMSRQLMTNPRALGFAAVLLLAFAAVPGFPWFLFLLLSAVLGFASYKLGKDKKPLNEVHGGESVKSMQRAGSKVGMAAIANQAPNFTCPLGVRISPELVDVFGLAALNLSFGSERARLQEELGLPFPGITMWTSDRLPPGTCEILMHDVPHMKIELPAGKVMLPVLGDYAPHLVPPTDPAAMTALMERCEAREPLDRGGARTYWIEEKGLPAKTPVWRAEEVVAHASVQLLRRHAALFLGVQEVQWILEQVSFEYPGLVAEVQKVLPPQRIADVLRRLLEENVSIRNTRNILESLISWGPKEKDMLMLTEYVRGDLARFLAYRAAKGQKQLSAVLFDMPVEQHVRQAIKQTPTGNFLALPPDEARFLVDSIESFVGTTPRDDVALVTSMDIRRYVRRLVEARMEWLAVYSYQELSGHVDLQPLGRVTI